MSARPVALLLACLLLGACATEGALAGLKRPRPTDVPRGEVETAMAPNALQAYNDYATPGLAFPSAHATVHYVLLGIDAPPLNDDDGNAVPDYVERVGAAADAAIDYYERRGFRAIRPDSAGPDGRPDLYISRFTPGLLGVAFPAARAEGGAFAVVSNALDPSAGVSFASAYGTVAHEIFHLVQFSYFRATDEPELPPWVLEGTAAGLETRVYPELEDIVSSLQLRAWLRSPQRTIADQTYGAQLLWRQLDERYPRLLPAVLARFASHRKLGSGRAAVVDTFAHVTRRPFASAFHRFAVFAADAYGDRLTAYRVLAPGERHHAAVAPLAIHYLRLGRRPCSLTVTFSDGRAAAGVALVYQWESDVAGYASALRQITGRASSGGKRLTFSVPIALARSPRFATPLLVVSNGGASGHLAYSVAVR